MPRSDKERLVDAVQYVNDEIQSKGHKGIKLKFEGAVTLFADKDSPARPAFKLVCKKDGKMLGVAPEKLSNIFIEVTPLSMHAAATTADFMSGSQFDKIQTQEFSLEDAIKSYVKDIANIDLD